MACQPQSDVRLPGRRGLALSALRQRPTMGDGMWDWNTEIQRKTGVAVHFL